MLFDPRGTGAAYESGWGWLVAPDPMARVTIQGAMGGSTAPIADVDTALDALHGDDAATILASDAWLAGRRYLDAPRPLFTRLPFDYRRVPAPMRGLALRLLERARGGTQPSFPDWPIETRLDEARARTWADASRVSGQPLVAPAWPTQKRAAVVLTHDLDVAADIDRIEAVRVLERSFGVPSAFGFVPRITPPRREVLDRLTAEGCEAYVHDEAHDGRLAYQRASGIEAGFARLFDRNPWARPLLRGFRSGQLLMSPALMDVVSRWFDYDLSMPDVERGGPYGSVAGAGTVIPFALGELIELPLTMPQDFFLEQVLHLDESAIVRTWGEKLEYIASRGGVAVVNVHPVWVNPQRHSLWRAYRQLLESIVSRPALWVTTPGAVVRYLQELRRGRYASDSGSAGDAAR
jgi:hypothetical protein